MSNGIEISATGNLTNDIELRFSSNGRPWARFSVAVNEIGRTASGERTESTTYLNCKLFGDAAEHAAASLGKGMRVLITGKIRSEKWTDSSGVEKKDMTLYVDEIGPSLRWATAEVTKASREVQAPVAARQSSNGGDYASDISQDEENPFLA
ncbi:MAG: single-stranded DNA-binding protein [Candidatus Paceibacterota bacterium]